MQPLSGILGQPHRILSLGSALPVVPCCGELAGIVVILILLVFLVIVVVIAAAKDIGRAQSGEVYLPKRPARVGANALEIANRLLARI